MEAIIDVCVSPTKVIKPQIGNTPEEKQLRVKLIKAKKKEICDIISSGISNDEMMVQITNILINLCELQQIFDEWHDESFCNIPDWGMALAKLQNCEVRQREFQKCSFCKDIRRRGHLCDGIIQARESREFRTAKANVKKEIDVLEGIVMPIEEDNNNPKINDDARSDNISIFEVPNRLSFVAWNAHTLSSMDDEKVSPELWEQICLEFSKHDVITLTEMLPISEGTGKERFERFFKMIKDCGNDEWDYRVSEPAGPGRTIEVHIMLVKKPIIIVDSETIKFSQFDYKPLIAHLRDERMACQKFSGDFVVTSIHMPPSNPKERRIARDRQIYNLMRGYIFSSENRCDRSFTNIGAVNSGQSPTIHIMQGDWNKWIGFSKDETISMAKAGFEVVLSENVYTTSGGKCYDNFIISDNYSKYLNIPTRKVLRFKNFFNSRTGASGLSDHAPIMFELEVLK